MKTLSGILGLTLASVAALASANAADLNRGPEAGGYKDSPAYYGVNWSGFYLGGHIGGAWGDVGFYDYYTYGQVFDQGSFGVNSLIGGGQLGYNFQRGALLVGVEADFGHLDLSGSKTDYYSDPGQPPVQVGTYKSSSGFYGDVTGRIGMTTGRTLFYGKGGVAFLNAEFTNLFGRVSNPGSHVSAETHTLIGWTLGGGVEYRLNANWSVKAEYQHFDFGDVTIQYKGIDEEKIEFSAKADAVTAGVNYRFGGSHEPLK